MTARPASAAAALRLPGLVMAGYGLLVLVGVLAHEETWVGVTCLAGGAALAFFGFRRRASTRPPERATPPTGATPLRAAGAPEPSDATMTQDAPPSAAGTALRRRVVLVLAAVCSIGVVAYNAATRSSFSLPEWAILAYGLALGTAAPWLDLRLGRRDPPVAAGAPGPGPVTAASTGAARAPDAAPAKRGATVGDLVGWSFALVLAPLALFALNAFISRGEAGAALQPAVAALVVAPTAFALELLGTPLALDGDNITVATPRGTLVLGVGLVCAGLYPMVLFGGLLAVHAWRERLPWRRAAALAAIGLAGLWLVNILRLLILVRVGIAHGPAALDATHANAGWILFAVAMFVFWWLVHRHERRRAEAGRPPSGNVPG